MTIKNKPTEEHLELLEGFRKHFKAFFEQGYWSRSIQHDKMVMLNNLYKYLTGTDKDVNLHCEDCVKNMLSVLYKGVLLAYHPDNALDKGKTYGVNQDWEIEEIKDNATQRNKMRYTGNSLECKHWIDQNKVKEPIKMDLSGWHHTWKKWLNNADRVDLEKVCIALKTHKQEQLEHLHPLDMKAAIKAELIKRGDMKVEQELEQELQGEIEEATNETHEAEESPTVETDEPAHDPETGQFVPDDPETPERNEHFQERPVEELSREELIEQHVILFGKKPVANIKTQTLRKKVADEIQKTND